MNATAKQIADVMGGSKSLGQSVRTTIELVEFVKHGVPKTALDSVVIKLAGPDDNGLAGAALRNKIVPRATYNRAKIFNLQTSETIERMARLYVIAREALGGEAAANAFLMGSHPELDGQTPFDAALTEAGGRQVEEVIERGLHGLPA